MLTGLLGAAYTVVVFLIGYFVGRKNGARIGKGAAAMIDTVRRA